jgi:hypothetical protein
VIEEEDFSLDEAQISGIKSSGGWSISPCDESASASVQKANPL